MKTIKKGLVWLLAVGALAVTTLNVIRNNSSFNKAGIQSGQVPSNTIATLYRNVVDMNGDGTPDKTIGYTIAVRTLIVDYGLPTAEETTEFYRQKEAWENR